MPRFSFHVSQGKFSGGCTETACAGREAARQHALASFSFDIISANCMKMSPKGEHDVL
jgi:hypothetical protein